MNKSLSMETKKTTQECVEYANLGSSIFVISKKNGKISQLFHLSNPDFA